MVLEVRADVAAAAAAAAPTAAAAAAAPTAPETMETVADSIHDATRAATLRMLWDLTQGPQFFGFDLMRGDLCSLTDFLGMTLRHPDHTRAEAIAAPMFAIDRDNHVDDLTAAMCRNPSCYARATLAYKAMWGEDPPWIVDPDHGDNILDADE